MIDLDECGVEVQSADRHLGKSYVGKRVKQTGPYTTYFLQFLEMVPIQEDGEILGQEREQQG
jgi:hypothetical protein